LRSFAFGQFFRRSASDDRIFKDARAPARDVRNLREDVQLRLGQATAVFENQILIVRLNRERGNYALVRLSEEVHAQVKGEWVVFDDGRVDRRSQFVEFDLWRPLEIGKNLQARERAVLFTRVVGHADAADIRDALGSCRTGPFPLPSSARLRARAAKRVLLIRIAGDAILTAAGRIDELDFDSGTYAGKVSIEPTLERISRSRTAAFIRFAIVMAA
jgi:hypothetical protein